MPVPSNPTTLTLVADAMNQAIHTLNATSVSAVVINNAPAFLENVKVQLWGASTTDKLLETTAVMIATTGSSQVTLPDDFDHELELRVYDGPTDSNRGTLQAGYTGGVQLQSDFSADPSGLIGIWFFTLGGMGSGQEAQIATYDDTTKFATFASALTTAPTSTSTYVVATEWWTIPKWDRNFGVHYNGAPMRYRMVATTTYIDPPADQQYPIRLYYGANLTRLNDSGFIFVRHMRERRYYWLQGLKVETQAQFDDDRYQGELAKWQVVLANYAGKNPVYTQASFVR